MCNRIHRHTIFCILPPYILESIVNHGSREQANAALRTLGSDTTFRAMRARPAAAMPGLVPRHLLALMFEGEKHRAIYDAGGQEDVLGTLVRSEGDPPSADVAVNEAYDGLGNTFDFYWQVFDRNSIDDKGMPLNANVHYGGKTYRNANWDGQMMHFGDGDDDLFNRFTIDLDIIGHELTHGVTQHEANLDYLAQPGALNESMSDVFGALIKQYALKQDASQADWLIGAKLLTPKVHGIALRSMKAPGTAFDDPVLGKGPQPGHMRDYLRTHADYGGVHINSGIPNHAFYLAAVQIGGYAWEKAGRIWYETLRDPHLRPNTGFRRFARLTYNTAVHLYGVQAVEAKAVSNAWNQVGIPLS